MKNNFKYLATVLVSLLFLTSCEEDVLVYTPESSYAQLTSSTTSTMSKSSTTGTTIKVVLVTVSNDSGESFDFTVTGDSSRYTITPADGKVVFSAGSYEATITVTPVDNNVSDGNADLTITLTGENVGVGGDGVNLTSVAVTIIDDDCPIVIDDTALWISQYDDSRADATEVELTKLGDNQWYCPTTWGYNGVANFTGAAGYAGLYPYDVVITLNPSDLTVLVEGLDGWAIGGSGSYDPCANTFTIPVLDDALFSNGGLDSGWTLTGK